MSEKKCVTIPEYQEEFLEENNISPSALLQDEINRIIGMMSGRKRSGEVAEVVKNE